MRTASEGPSPRRSASKVVWAPSSESVRLSRRQSSMSSSELPRATAAAPAVWTLSMRTSRSGSG